MDEFIPTGDEIKLLQLQREQIRLITLQNKRKDEFDEAVAETRRLEEAMSNLRKKMGRDGFGSYTSYGL